jgi:predicted acylesterase/phospholipase RssA
LGHASWAGRPLPLGECVAASAAFPPVFPPARIETSSYSFSGPIYSEPPIERRSIVALADGGVYDNLGVEVAIKVVALPGLAVDIHPARFLVVSDAGAPGKLRFRSSGIPGFGAALLLYRADAIAREQISAQRRRDLVRAFSDPNSPRKGILIAIGSGINKIPTGHRARYAAYVKPSCLIPENLLAKIRGLRTHLNKFSRVECEALMYHSYSMTDAFLWAHRETCPLEYQVPVVPNPFWRIEFTDRKIAEWHYAIS